MSTNTTNYNLVKPNLTDSANINVINSNMDTIDSTIKSINDQNLVQTAGGTATAITLTFPTTLTNGYQVTFVASANNNGSTTTINGKYLYKPVTKTPPTLITGKAYTAWYNSTSDCFFIKASAEGNTIAAHVLAGDTFSNDTDTGLVGTLDLSQLVSGNLKSGVTISNGYTNITGSPTVVDTLDAVLDPRYLLTGYSGYDDGVKKNGTMVNHTGTDSPANSIAGTGTGRIYVRPQQGYYDGSVASYVDDSNFNSANIVSGKSIFGLQGTVTPRYFASGTIPEGSYINTTTSYTIPLGFTATSFEFINTSSSAINNTEGKYSWSAQTGWLYEYYHYATHPYPAIDTSNNSIRLFTSYSGMAIGGNWYAWG